MRDKRTAKDVCGEASHMLARARHVARRVTEGRRPKGHRGTNCRVKKSLGLRSIECVTKL